MSSIVPSSPAGPYRRYNGTTTTYTVLVTRTYNIGHLLMHFSINSKKH